MFKDKCVTIPIALQSTPLCGIPDADCVRNLFDLSLWLDSTPGYCLGRYNQVVGDTSEFATNRFERQGRINFPGSIPPLSENAEPALIYTLLTELSSKYKLGLDTEPNLSRRLVLTPAPPTGSGETPALFIGFSNVDRLVNAVAAVGLIQIQSWKGDGSSTTPRFPRSFPRLRLTA
jgi:hypothetical protein